MDSIGKNIVLTVFGESHGPFIGATLDGLKPGIKIDLDFIKSRLERRKAKGKISTPRHEGDEPIIVSGVYDGYTTGTALTIIIENKSQKSGDYKKTGSILRPSHADLTAFYKYHGFQDVRGGGHFSGRLTAPLVAVGAIAESALNQLGIYVGTHIKSIDSIVDTSFETLDSAKLKTQIDAINSNMFPTLSDEIAKKMNEKIESVAEDSNSIGGILETGVAFMQKGIGSPMMGSVESVLAALAFSVPAVKGVEFGKGFLFGSMTGDKANDCYKMENEEIALLSNNNGGILGGITTGAPIIMSTVIKPTPSIFKEQQSVDYDSKKDAILKIEGRHDPAIIHRAAPVLSAVTSIGLLDLIYSN